jgi:hypothetical protein
MRHALIDGRRLRRVDLGGASEIPAYQWRYQLRPSTLDADSAEDLPRPQTLAASLAVTNGERERDVDSRMFLDRVAAAYAGEVLAGAFGRGRFAVSAAHRRGAYRAPTKALPPEASCAFGHVRDVRPAGERAPDARHRPHSDPRWQDLGLPRRRRHVRPSGTM